ITVTRQAGHEDNYFIQIFMGVLTAAGGGLLRDTMAGERPYIFTKHIYAIASIIGGVVFIIVMEMSNEFAGVISSCVLMILIRLLAAHYRWSLPKIKSM
ncbi:MAG: TRIC cation channel family protein, partial [Oscillospiraceae bacterium]|nr:TRIC cation channel family protein [Oscillospiraceae bacterium]